MKKIVSYLILTIISLLIVLISILATLGIETNKFNQLISYKVSETRNIDLEIDTIKFKINLKKFSLFLETQNPKISYRNLSFPIKNIKLHINFLSLLKSDPKIEKTNIFLEELDIKQINRLSTIIKPSNLKSLINNKIKEGRLISEFEIFFTKQGDVKNFITRGEVKALKAELLNDFNLSQVNFTFFADKDDILIKNVFGNLEDIKISDGDIKLNLEKGIKINSNFNTKFYFDEKLSKKYLKIFSKYNFIKNIKSMKADFSNNLNIDLDKTYKVQDYSYSIAGEIEKGRYELPKPIKNSSITEEIKTIILSDFKIKGIFNSKSTNLNGDGKYSFDNLDFLNISFENDFAKDQINLKLNFDYKNSFELGLINYKKSKDVIANFSLDLSKKSDYLAINKLDYKEGKNSITVIGLEFQGNKFLLFDKIKIETPGNNFFIQYDKKILIKGIKFDATNLAKFFKKSGNKNFFNKLNSNIEIDFKIIKVPMSEELKNFKLIGEIRKGQFVKISSKGDFGENNFLDISMKKDRKLNQKYLEVYSDLTRPLLTEYSFFNGLTGGKLLFTSTIDEKKAKSNLKIENFKVVNAPGLIKLLSLADLSGLADLAEGEGLSFDLLEIAMEKNDGFLELTEIIALGPSMSVLIEGYQDKSGLTSLRGTLVPAKTLNKLISKIPVIGNIIIPKEVGEGLFGVSFKMKGPKGKIKTTINPIRTLTPRFLQKIVDRNKKSK